MKDNFILLNEEQYRLLVCIRLTRILGLGEIVIDITTHRVLFTIEKRNLRTYEFCSLEKLETFLEHTLEQKIGNKRIASTTSLRIQVLSAKKKSRRTRERMLLKSSV